MNIFFLDNSPKKAAEYQCNKHVVKMILESAQLLCGVHHELGTQKLPEKFYRKTHINHPCAIWARQRLGNYVWLAQHAMHLCQEYTWRYGKIHLSQSLIEWLVQNPPNLTGEFVDPPQCMPDEFRGSDCIKAYRLYYFLNKRLTIECKWTKREKPEWWNETI